MSPQSGRAPLLAFAFALVACRATVTSVPSSSSIDGTDVCMRGSTVECRAACDRGSLTACASLGGMYASGDRVARNPELARAFLGRACDGGIASACTELGFETMMDGAMRGNALDGAAIPYFHRACALDAMSCSMLGAMARDDAEKRFAYQRECAAMPDVGDACGRVKDLGLPPGARP